MRGRLKPAPVPLNKHTPSPLGGSKCGSSLERAVREQQNTELQTRQQTVQRARRIFCVTTVEERPRSEKAVPAGGLSQALKLRLPLSYYSGGVPVHF